MESVVNVDLSFFKGKTVLVTGHTGFKGSWLCRILISAGANVIGYGLEPPTTPNLFELSQIENLMNSIIGDIRDFEHLFGVFNIYRPEIVIHMAAQPLVRESYEDPRYTYETNVMGTVNVLECIRKFDCVKSVLNVTTDKVYRNNEWEWGYRENEPLDGFDPYSNSKSCSELVTHSYNNSFFSPRELAISTARAGNVIGGGDFAKDRIIPDCVRAVSQRKNIEVRNPFSTRPYQHVLEPLFMYLKIVEYQYNDISYAGYYNIGPDEEDCISTGELVSLFCKYWGEEAHWDNVVDSNAVHEANFLKLDCSKVKKVFGWKPTWHIEKCVEKTVDFSKAWLKGDDLCKEMDNQICEFMEDSLF